MGVSGAPSAVELRCRSRARVRRFFAESQDGDSIALKLPTMLESYFTLALEIYEVPLPINLGHLVAQHIALRSPVLVRSRVAHLQKAEIITLETRLRFNLLVSGVLAVPVQVCPPQYFARDLAQLEQATKSDQVVCESLDRFISGLHRIDDFVLVHRADGEFDPLPQSFLAACLFRGDTLGHRYRSLML